MLQLNQIRLCHLVFLPSNAWSYYTINIKIGYYIDCFSRFKGWQQCCKNYIQKIYLIIFLIFAYELALKTCLVIPSSRGAFVKHICFRLPFLTFYKFCGHLKKQYKEFSLIIFVQKRLKYFRNLFRKIFKFSRWIIPISRVHKIYWAAEEILRCFWNNIIFVQPDIDYFVVFRLN